MSDENDIEEPSEEELREAAALRAALEERDDKVIALKSPQDAPKDALETALFLKHGTSDLDASRKDDVLGRVLERHSGMKRRRVIRALGWAVPPFALAAAIALVVLRPSEPEHVVLPAPTTSLIRAQIAASRGDDDGLAEEMRSYRRAMFQSLESQYGGETR